MQCLFQNEEIESIERTAEMFCSIFFFVVVSNVYKKGRRPKKMLGITVIEGEPGGEYQGSRAKTNLAGFTADM